MTVKRLTGYGENSTDFRELAGYLSRGEEWRMGTMRAINRYPNQYFGNTGNLPATEEQRESLDRSDYVIYSYYTPIAWHDVDKGWVQPDVKYSRTTTKHQGRIAVAISVLEG